MEKIKEVLFKGIKQGRDLLIDLSLDFFNEEVYKIVEYSIVVNIAQNLNIWNKNKHYKIYLEGSANKFYENAFENHTYKNDSFEQINSKQYKPQRNEKGKIDIVIYQSINSPPNNIRSKYAIEVKGILEGFTPMYKDLDRLIDALTLEQSESSFINSIDTCYFCYIKNEGIAKSRFENKTPMEDKDILSKADLESKKKNSNNKLKKKLEDKYKGRNVKIDITDCEILIQSKEDFSDKEIADEGYNNIAKKIKIVFAVVIEIQRAEKFIINDVKSNYFT